MSLRKCLLLTMLFAVVAWEASGRVSLFKAKFEVLKLDMWLRAPMPTVAFAGYGSQLANKPSRTLRSFHGKGTLPPPSLIPIQFKDPKELGAGKLLVASRSLGDPDFAETVVLLVHYDAKGALGLILNRRTDVPLSQVFALKAAKDRSDPVYLGGPVEPTAVFALYRSSAKMKKAENIFGGVYLIADKGLFERILSAKPSPSVFHAYLGYAGWAPGQLQAEVHAGAWYVFPAAAAAVFNSNPDSLWPQMIQETQFQWAKTEPFAELSQPAEFF